MRHDHLDWAGYTSKLADSIYYEVGMGPNPHLCHKDNAARNIIDYPDVLAWGYKGNGPKQLAVAILHHTVAYRDYVKFQDWALHCDEARKIALAHHVKFMEEVVSKLPAKWELSEEFIFKWLKKQGVKIKGFRGGKYHKQSTPKKPKPEDKHGKVTTTTDAATTQAT